MNVDVEVVDENLDIIAASYVSGFDDEIERCIMGNAYRKVLKTGTHVVIPNPGNDEICRECEQKGSCHEVYEMGMPIKIKSHLIGVIGFVCYSEEQRSNIISNFSLYFDFLKQISEMIASEVYESVEKIERLKLMSAFRSIIEKVDEGVLILNRYNQVTQMNPVAERMLGKTFFKVKNIKAEIKRVESTVEGKEQYDMHLGGKLYSLLGKYYDMGDTDDSLKVFLFVDIFTYKNRLLTYTNIRENFGLDKIIGESQVIEQLKEKVKMIPSSSTVMITGESGTGKEMFARAIHEMGSRTGKPFVALNCAAIPETLLESELFGYEKGAFTGADVNGKIGKIELADSGILFLDEIGDMPLYLQAKLLRVVEDRSVTKIGSTKSREVDIQVISATNKNLITLIDSGMFREDLFYRLNVIPIEIPALRSRKEDIRLISMQFIEKYIDLFEKKLYKIENSVWEYFENYNWPGNVRELQNVIEYLVSMIGEEGVIRAKNLPFKIISYEEEVETEEGMNLESLEKRTIKKALLYAKLHRKSNQFVADQLGIGIATLYRKINRYQIVI
jgi:transcriptional regulator with PAS, ATPase and Fis domain